MAPQSSYRPEVQGLRALAVLMVVTYHIWFGRVSGGVDVFLLISAFLLTLSFVRKVEAGRALDLGRYWLRQFKRLLPPVAVVLIGTLTATALFVPQSRWTDILSQSWSSLLYFQNWVLAAESVDYYAADHSTASPLQHFWSLSIQGQVFLLWPLLFAASAFLARTCRIRFRRVVLAVFGGVFIASLSFSILETYGNQAHAYFDTRTRLWEFALGTLLALALPYLKLPRGLRVAAGWLGLAAMLSVGFLLDVQGQFPGYVALCPLLAAALVILAGQTGSRIGADRLLSWKPLMRLGDMSYALYLWHWPVLVIYLIWRGRQEVGPLGGTAIIGLSLILAYLTTKLVERPLRSSDWVNRTSLRAVGVIAVCLAVVAAPLAGWQQGLRLQAEHLAEQAIKENPGARVLLADFDDVSSGEAQPIPAPSMMNQEWGGLPGDCTEYGDGPTDPLLAKRCMSTEPVTDPEKTILVVGDSHTEQWLGAIEPMAENHDYRVVALLLGGCSFGAYSESRGPACNDFNSAVLDYALELKPDAVVAMATAAQSADAADLPVAGLPEASELLRQEGIPVVGVRDNPRYDFDVLECAETHGAVSAECSAEVSEKLSNPGTVVSYFDSLPGVELVDMTDMICPGGNCVPLVGNVYVYMDSNHLTTTYTSSMADEFDRRFHAALGW
ncbi:MULTISPECIES: acyltransferase family protein [unclassified Arthrobacter]|uniref:acyltransferase family protein n=1 Tax=unclassified Arthrobacter TaxID=235627 RepID=UPI0024C4175C|nr:acyltransferase family protein [Arthrobacter sp. zg.Y820]MDK1278856.1 acyltransferase family protein [Arthrobacter sp. zg.Y820]